MLSEDFIIKIKILMVKKGINGYELAKELECTQPSLSMVFNKKKTLSNVESKLKKWYEKNKNIKEKKK